MIMATYNVVLSSNKKGFIKNELENASLKEAQDYLENRVNNFDNAELIYSVNKIDVLSSDLTVHYSLRENFTIEIVEVL